MKVLQDFIYKSANTGLLKFLVATSVFKYNGHILIFNIKYKVLQLMSMSVLNLTTLVATRGFKKDLHLEACEYRPIKIS